MTIKPMSRADDERVLRWLRDIEAGINGPAIAARDGVHPQTPGNTARKVMAALRAREAAS